jgi:hypothetical protein
MGDGGMTAGMRMGKEGMIGGSENGRVRGREEGAKNEKGARGWKGREMKIRRLTASVVVMRQYSFHLFVCPIFPNNIS